jgi:hypothetical protein
VLFALRFRVDPPDDAAAADEDEEAGRMGNNIPVPGVASKLPVE